LELPSHCATMPRTGTSKNALCMNQARSLPRVNPDPIRGERQPYTTSVLCPTSIMYPSGSRM
jgi:hypothetical protein